MTGRAAHHTNRISTLKDITIANYQKNNTAKNLEGLKPYMQEFIKEGFTGFCKNDEHNKADQAALNQCHVEYFCVGITDNSEHVNTHQKWRSEERRVGKECSSGVWLKLQQKHDKKVMQSQ